MSVAKALFGEGGNTHAPLSAVEMAFSEREFAAYFKFTFVRNPWDRLVSAYEFLRVGVGKDEYDKPLSDKVQSLGDFRSFVDWISNTNASEGMHFWPQSNYVRTDKSEMGMDFVGHFETIDQDVAHVAGRLGVTAALPHLNSSPSRRPYEEYFDAKTAELIGTVYQRDVDLFGYDFGNSRFKK